MSRHKNSMGLYQFSQIFKICKPCRNLFGTYEVSWLKFRTYFKIYVSDCVPFVLTSFVLSLKKLPAEQYRLAYFNYNITIQIE